MISNVQHANDLAPVDDGGNFKYDQLFICRERLKQSFYSHSHTGLFVLTKLNRKHQYEAPHETSSARNTKYCNQSLVIIMCLCDNFTY
jgi:hypothetical protein